MNLNRPYYALGLRLLAGLMLSTLMLLVKLAGEHGVSLPEVMFWRQAVPFVMLLGWLSARGKLATLRTERPGSHVRRSATGMFGMLFTLGAPRLMPLAETTVLSFTTPIFATILAATFLREKVGRWRWGAVIAGFAGVLVIAGPDRGSIPLPGLVVAIMAAVMVAIVNIQLRDLGRTEQPLAVVFWFSALGTAVLAPTLPFTMSSHDAIGWLILLGCGLTGLFGQLALTASLRFGAVTSVIVMDYFNLIWATLWGWLVFSQLPPFTTWFGAPLVIAAGIVIVWRERVRSVQNAVSVAQA